MGVCPSPKVERAHTTRYSAGAYSFPGLVLGSQLSSGVGSGEKGGGNQETRTSIPNREDGGGGGGGAEGGECMFFYKVHLDERL